MKSKSRFTELQARIKMYSRTIPELRITFLWSKSECSGSRSSILTGLGLADLPMYFMHYNFRRCLGH